MFSPGGSNGEDCFPSSLSSLLVVGWRFHAILRGHPHFLAIWVSSTGSSASLSLQVESLEWVYYQDRVLYNVMQSWEWYPVALAKFCWLEARHRFCQDSGGEGYSRAWLIGESQLECVDHIWEQFSSTLKATHVDFWALFLWHLDFPSLPIWWLCRPWDRAMISKQS